MPSSPSAFESEILLAIQKRLYLLSKLMLEIQDAQYAQQQKSSSVNNNTQKTQQLHADLNVVAPFNVFLTMNAIYAASHGEPNQLTKFFDSLCPSCPVSVKFIYLQTCIVSLARHVDKTSPFHIDFDFVYNFDQSILRTEFIDLLNASLPYIKFYNNAAFGKFLIEANQETKDTSYTGYDNNDENEYKRRPLLSHPKVKLLRQSSQRFNVKCLVTEHQEISHMKHVSMHRREQFPFLDPVAKGYENPHEKGYENPYEATSAHSHNDDAANAKETPPPNTSPTPRQILLTSFISQYKTEKFWPIAKHVDRVLFYGKGVYQQPTVENCVMLVYQGYFQLYSSVHVLLIALPYDDGANKFYIIQPKTQWNSNSIYNFYRDLNFEIVGLMMAAAITVYGEVSVPAVLANFNMTIPLNNIFKVLNLNNLNLGCLTELDGYSQPEIQMQTNDPEFLVTANGFSNDFNDLYQQVFPAVFPPASQKQQKHYEDLTIEQCSFHRINWLRFNPFVMDPQVNYTVNQEIRIDMQYHQIPETYIQFVNKVYDYKVYLINTPFIFEIVNEPFNIILMQGIVTNV